MIITCGIVDHNIIGYSDGQELRILFRSRDTRNLPKLFSTFANQDGHSLYVYRAGFTVFRGGNIYTIYCILNNKVDLVTFITKNIFLF